MNPAIATRNFQRDMEAIAENLRIEVSHKKGKSTSWSEVETRSSFDIDEDLYIHVFDESQLGEPRFNVIVFTLLQDRFNYYIGILNECNYIQGIKVKKYKSSFMFIAENLKAIEELLRHIKHHLTMEEE